MAEINRIDPVALQAQERSGQMIAPGTPGVVMKRFDESDCGTEIRLEIHLGGHVVEVTACHGIDGYSLDLWELGEGGESPYHSGRQLYELKET